MDIIVIIETSIRDIVDMMKPLAQPPPLKQVKFGSGDVGGAPLGPAMIADRF